MWVIRLTGNSLFAFLQKVAFLKCIVNETRMLYTKFSLWRNCKEQILIFRQVSKNVSQILEIELAFLNFTLLVLGPWFAYDFEFSSFFLQCLTRSQYFLYWSFFSNVSPRWRLPWFTMKVWMRWRRWPRTCFRRFETKIFRKGFGPQDLSRIVRYFVYMNHRNAEESIPKITWNPMPISIMTYFIIYKNKFWDFSNKLKSICSL